MAKTHEEVIIATEDRMLKALRTGDIATLSNFLHPDVIYTNENGEVFKGLKNLQINNTEVLCFKTIDVIERTVTTFNNVAIVNSFEKRTGKYLGLYFSSEYRLTRTWKFIGNQWILIATSAVVF